MESVRPLYKYVPINPRDPATSVCVNPISVKMLIYSFLTIFKIYDVKLFVKIAPVLTTYFTGSKEHDGATIQVRTGKELAYTTGLGGQMEHDCATIRSKTDNVLVPYRAGVKEIDSVLSPAEVDREPGPKNGKQKTTVENKTSRIVQNRSKTRKGRHETPNISNSGLSCPYFRNIPHQKSNKNPPTPAGFEPMFRNHIGRYIRSFPLRHENHTPTTTTGQLHNPRGYATRPTAITTQNIDRKNTEVCKTTKQQKKGKPEINKVCRTFFARLTAVCAPVRPRAGPYRDHG